MLSTNNMKLPLVILYLFTLIYCQSNQDCNNNINNDSLFEIATSEQLWTGVAVSDEGRIFVNFPRWGTPISMSVAELTQTGELSPYPNNKWNTWSEKGISPKNHFYCVQSVYIDNNNYLWILDSGNPSLKGIVKNAPKLLKINLQNNKVINSYRFKDTVLLDNSYLNDVRIDINKNFAYITDSGVGAIIVIDLSTGESRRILDSHHSIKAEEIIINVENINLPIKIHSDGIALSPDNSFIYYQALTSRKLYRINTEMLRDFTLTNSQIESEVEFMCNSGVTDGIAFDNNGYLYFTSIEKNAISRWLPPDGDIEILVSKSNIKWPDSISITSDLDLYFTTSQLHLGTTRTEPFRLFKIKLK